MRKRVMAMWTVVALGCLVSQTSLAASYFVDSVVGNDSNSGLSESAPWRTIAKLNGSTFPFGSTIFLKRGSVWHEQFDIPSSGLTIDAYGTGALPSFDGSEPIENWRFDGRGVYSRVIPIARPGAVGGLGNVTENGVFMKHMPWLGTAAKSLTNAPTGSFTFQVPFNRLYIKPAVNPVQNTYRVSTLLIGIHAENKSDVTVQNVSLVRQSLFGIRFGNCNRCTARDSTISDGGGAIVYSLSIPYLYTGNGVEFSGQSEDGLVEGLMISNMFDSGVTPQSYDRNSRLSRITFRNSIIERCGYAGVEISALQTGKPSTLENIKVSGLTIRDSGRGWSGNRYGNTGHGVLIQANDGNGTISGVEVDTTTVVNSVGDGVRISGEVGTLSLNRLTLAANSDGVNASNLPGTARSLKLQLTASLIFLNRRNGLLYASEDAVGFDVSHNTFHDNQKIGFAIFRQNGQALIRNNIFSGSVPLPHLYVDGAITLRGPSIDNNCYVTSPTMIRYHNVSYDALPPFTAATQFETKGVATKNVRFVNPGALDFKLQGNSPCVRRGASGTGVAVDRAGRRYKSKPSIGALERY